MVCNLVCKRVLGDVCLAQQATVLNFSQRAVQKTCCEALFLVCVSMYHCMLPCITLNSSKPFRVA